MNLLAMGYIRGGQNVNARMNQVFKRGWVLLAALLMLLAGCAKDKNDQGAGTRNISPAEAQRLQSEGRKFETTKDPPITAETHFAAAQLAESQGAYPTAIAQYNEALKLQPNNQPAMFQLGVLYTQQKTFPEAVAMWQRYIKATNGAAQGYNNLALCYQAAGKTAEAEQAFKAAMAKEPKDVATRVNYGLMLAQLNRIDEATAQLGTVLKPAAVHYNLGAVYEQQGRKDRAKSEFKKALELDPELKDARIRLEAVK